MTAQPGRRHARTRGADRLSRARPDRAAGALLAGGAACALVLGARAAHVAEGGAALVAAALVVLAVPTSRELSRRVALNLAVVVGWVPVLWWTPRLTTPLGRTPWLVAVAVGALVVWVVGARPGSRERARRILPRARPADAVAAGAVALVAGLAVPFLRAVDGAVAMSVMLPGWDHAPHANMVAMIRQHGTVVSSVADPAPGAGTWSYADYPQHFHALAASLTELLVPVGTDGGALRAVLYARAVGLTMVLSAALIATSLCGIPWLRRRPAAAALSVSVVVGAVFLGPGGWLIYDGFTPFLLAVACLVAAASLVAVWPRVVSPVPLLALGGLVVAVAHTWALVLVMLVPLASAVLLPARRERWRASAGRWCGSLVVVLATAAAVGKAAALLAGGPPIGDFVAVNGGIRGPALGLVIALPLAAVAACLYAFARSPRGSRRGYAGDESRWLALAAGGATALACALVVGARIFAEVGELRYYFWKLSIAVILLSTGLLVVALASAGRTPRAAAGRSRITRTAAAAVAVVAATQVWGAAFPPVGAYADLASAPGALAWRTARELARQPVSSASPVVAAAEGSVALGDQVAVVPLAYPRAVFGEPVQAGLWYYALAGRWTDEVLPLLSSLTAVDDSDASAAAAARAVLEADQEVEVLVLGGQEAVIREALGPELASRVIAP